MPFINSVMPYKDYKLLIELGNGHAIILDMETKINTFRFSLLENEDFFRKVYTDGSSVIWKGGIVSISFNEIIQMLKIPAYMTLVG